MFYSLSGYPRKVAYALAQAVDADNEEIRDLRPRTGVFGYVRSIYEALSKREAPIRHMKYDPENYSVVIIGTPVWASRGPSPARTYITRYRARIRRVAWYCTCGGLGVDPVVGEAVELCLRRPVAMLALRDSDIDAGRDRDKLRQFIDALR